MREELRRWRRPDDPFVYEMVIVGSGEEALIAARLNANPGLRDPAAIRSRSRHDLSALADFTDRASPTTSADRSPRSGPRCWPAGWPSCGPSSICT